MKKITVITPTSKPISKKQRVAAYARVSMETERLMHSLSSQVSYYSEFIQANPDWEYAGVFADSFILINFFQRQEGFEDLNLNVLYRIVWMVKSILFFARVFQDLQEIPLTFYKRSDN